MEAHRSSETNLRCSALSKKLPTPAENWLKVHCGLKRLANIPEDISHRRKKTIYIRILFNVVR